MAFAVAIYVLMPLLAQVKKLKTHTLTALVCALFVANGLRLAAGVGAGRQHADLILYAAFVLTGYLLRDRLLGRKNVQRTAKGHVPKTGAAFAALTAVSAAAFLVTYINDGYQNAFAARGLDIWWYYSPFITLTAVLLFAALLAVSMSGGGRKASLLAFLSENSFGVYLVHIAVIRICFRAAFFTDTARTTIGTAALAAIGTLAVSYVIAAACGKIPGIRFLFLKKSLRKN